MQDNNTWNGVSENNHHRKAKTKMGERRQEYNWYDDNRR